MRPELKARKPMGLIFDQFQGLYELEFHVHPVHWVLIGTNEL